MGQTLSEPVTEKKTKYCQNGMFKVGSSCMQGWRINMEDAHTHILSCPDDPDCAFFGVYDGHGGCKIAQHAGKHLHKYIMKRSEYKEGNIDEALKQGFLDLDSAMLEEETLKDELAGSTAICIIIKDGKLYCIGEIFQWKSPSSSALFEYSGYYYYNTLGTQSIQRGLTMMDFSIERSLQSWNNANVGDSRAIASVWGGVLPLSYDHKPGNEDEMRRITAAGGWVEFNRVNGNLALSRALGDFVFKKNDKKRPEEQIVTAMPDVQTHSITQDWEFVVVACDGIWDVMTNEEVADFVRMRIGTGMAPDAICEDLMTRCLAPDCQMGGLGCDNMTVVIICFLHNKPYSELTARCIKPPHT